MDLHHQAPLDRLLAGMECPEGLTVLTDCGQGWSKPGILLEAYFKDPPYYPNVGVFTITTTDLINCATLSHLIKFVLWVNYRLFNSVPGLVCQRGWQ